MAREPLYRVNRKIGEGGMGTVYSATRLEDGRRVALKTPDWVKYLDEPWRFPLEVYAASSVCHPHSVTVLDYGRTNVQVYGLETNLPYFVMEYIEGGTVRDMLLRTGASLGASILRKTVNIARQACSGLHAAYEEGIIHRDVRPDNIMLAGTSGDAKVIDYGIARILGDDKQMDEEEDMLFGEPSYMAPEQIRHQEVSPRTDIYGLGVTIYVMVTGKFPLVGCRVEDILAAHLGHEPEPPSRMRPEIPIPPKLDDIVLRALAKNPGDRYQTMLEMEADLAGVVFEDVRQEIHDDTQIPYI